MRRLSTLLFSVSLFSGLALVAGPAPAASGSAPGQAGAAWEQQVPLVVPPRGPAEPAAKEQRKLSCAQPENVPGQGRSCRTAHGWDVELADGSVVHTHGPDGHAHPGSAEGGVAAVGAGGPGATPSDPRCVTSADYGVQVIYAVPTGKTNRFSSVVSTIRSTVKEMNGRVNEAGTVSGNKRVDIKILCDGAGVISVANETLPTALGSENFSTISSDLRARGYSSSAKKYLVFYDAPVSGYCGQGNWIGDDTLRPGNVNNYGGDFAITYSAFDSCSGSRTPLHELGHVLGAVQDSAPDTSGAAHCNDGSDVMCYQDGGPTQCTTDFYCLNTCFDYEHFDCGHDSYFDAAPAANSYLANHWNLGSTLNRYFYFGPETTTETWQQEAEAFGARPVGGQCTSSTASGGKCWNIWSNGSITATTTSVTSGLKRITVQALGDPAGGVWPNMEVYVDGYEVMDLSVASDTWGKYSAAVQLEAGLHTVEVRYTNDGSVSGNDRNLLVDYASISNAERTWLGEGENFTTKTAGGRQTDSAASGGAYWNIWSNGHIETTMTVPYTSQHQLEIRARGDVADQIWPDMDVYVDGVLRMRQTAYYPTWNTWRVPITLSGGSHTVKIVYTNDAIVGTEDRNLEIDYAALYS